MSRGSLLVTEAECGHVTAADSVEIFSLLLNPNFKQNKHKALTVLCRQASAAAIKGSTDHRLLGLRFIAGLLWKDLNACAVDIS